MDKNVNNGNQVEEPIEMETAEQKNSHDNEISDEDESYKSCNDPFSSCNVPLLIEEEANEKGAVEYTESDSVMRSYPPEMVSEDSADTFSDNGSDEIYYSEIENDNDSDISNPATQENMAASQGEVEVSFQRELLDYLGSFLNMESRFRLRENRQTVEVSEDQLSEYGRLRMKVNQDLKVLGIGGCKDLASSDQNIALNLHFVLAGRERGDWTSCRRSSRVVPMWSFEKRERLPSEPHAESRLDENRLMESGDLNKEPVLTSGGKKIDGRKSRNCWRADADAFEKKIVTGINSINNVVRDEKYTVCGSLRDPVGNPTSPVLEIEENPSEPDKLVFRTTQKVKYLKDLVKKRPGKSPGERDATRPMLEHISNERVQTHGVCDVKSAIYASRWAVRRLGLEARFPAHEGCVNALHFSSNGQWIASGSDDRNIVVTDWQHQHQLSRFTVGHSSNIFQVRFLPGSNDLEIVSCSRDSTVRYAALSTTGQLQYSRLLTRHKDCCHKLAVPIDQPCLVISASEDTRVLAADVRAPHALGKICKVDKVPLYSISCNPVRSQEFAVAGKDSRVFIYDRRKPSESLFQMCPENLNTKPRNSYHVTSVVYSKTGQSVLASYNDDDIYLFSTAPRPERTPCAIRRYQGHRNVQTVTGVSFYGPQHEYVVSGSNDGHVLVWERDSEALVNWFRADENGVVNVLEAHPTMPILATAGLDHDVKIWSMLGADSGIDRGLPLDQPLLERDAETSRIDFAWKTLDLRRDEVDIDPIEDSTDFYVPFNLRDLKVITALNWKMRDESYPYSIDNNLDNLLLADLQIFMSRRHRGEIFLSDSESADSYESVPDLNGDRAVPGSSDRNASGTATSSSRTSRPGRDTAADSNRPDGCRSS